MGREGNMAASTNGCTGPRHAAARHGSWGLRALGLVLAFVALASAPARAQEMTFVLNTGPTFSLGSGDALATSTGLYPAGTQFPVQLTPLGPPDTFSMQVSSFTIPDIVFGAFDSELFTFELLSGGAPTDSFTLTLDLATGDINPTLSDPPLQVEMSRTIDGVPSGTDVFDLDLTTGQIQIPACGGAPTRNINGSPRDSGTGAVKLVGGVCLTTFAGSPFNLAFEIKLDGTLEFSAAPVPALSPVGLALLATLLLASGVAALGRPGPLAR
jgi:hypothetical protein